MAKVKKMAFGGMGSKLDSSARALSTVAPAVSRQIQNALSQNMNPAFRPARATQFKQVDPAALKADMVNTAQAYMKGLGMYGNKPQAAKNMELVSNLGSAISAAGRSATSSLGGLPQKLQTASAASMMKSGGVTSSASKRADGCAVKGKTKGRML